MQDRLNILVEMDFTAPKHIDWGVCNETQGDQYV
jgi:hypothetical protein